MLYRSKTVVQKDHREISLTRMEVNIELGPEVLHWESKMVHATAAWVPECCAPALRAVRSSSCGIGLAGHGLPSVVKDGKQLGTCPFCLYFGAVLPVRLFFLSWVAYL